MATSQGLQTSRRMLFTILRPAKLLIPSKQAHLAVRTSLRTRGSVRHASSNTLPPKTIVLEQPDKFRPPSHPQRLVKSRGRVGSGYNQQSTGSEREAQKTKRYPHTFPNEGTVMHRFLTNKLIHLWITMGTLTFLAAVSLTQSFMKTSPYAHLLPPFSSFPSHPIHFFKETWSVIRLHMEYTTEKTALSRRDKILDAQKRRLYRRAHGMENLDADEEQGIDVRGLVPWDDGLTNKERAAGGRDLDKKVGGKIEDYQELVQKVKALEAQGKIPRSRADIDNVDLSAVPSMPHDPEEPAPSPPRKRKLWLGIW